MRFWLPNHTNGMPELTAGAVPLDGELVGLRATELEQLAGLLDGQEARHLVHGTLLDVVVQSSDHFIART